MAAYYIGKCWKNCQSHPSGWAVHYEEEDGTHDRMDYRDAVRIGIPDGEFSVGASLDPAPVLLMVGAFLAALGGR